MKEGGGVWTLVLVGLVLAVVVGAGLSVWLIGAERLMTLALILVGGLVLAVVVGASALPIRAYRRRDMTGETHYVHDGTKTIIRERVIDSRPAPFPALPAPAQTPFGVFPELLRASYQAGRLAAPRADVVDADVRELPPGDGWAGEIAL